MTGFDSPSNNVPSTDEPTTPMDAPESRGRLRWLLLIAVSMAVASYWIRPTAAISGHSPAVGLPAPPIKLVAFNTTEQTPPASRAKWDNVDFSGPHITMVHFWGTWCGPCRHELPDLATLHDELSQHPRFRLYAVTCEAFDDPSIETLLNRTHSFYRSADIDMPVYADPTTDARAQFVRMMQREEMVYPMTILVDHDGIIRATWVGIPPGGVNTIRNRVQELLSTTE